MSIVVVFSGGQDSTTCLGWAIQNLAFGNPQAVLALSINYGQRHAVELQAAATIARQFGVRHKTIDVGPILQGTSPLLQGGEGGVETYRDYESLPGGLERTFVPGRNALFLTIAGNVAYVEEDYAVRVRHPSIDTDTVNNSPELWGTLNIVTGVCQADFGGYPDCRQDYIDAQRSALQEALGRNVMIHTPLMNLSKSESVLLARDLGPVTWNALGHSHTCYQGSVPPCGKCHSCLLRQRGFDEAGYVDPLIERLS